jgi:sec-independent protein translocase protein TatA
MNMLNTLAFLNSPQDWLILLVIVLVLFGGAKIPQLMRGVGQGLGEFKKGVEDAKTATTTTPEA